MLKPLAAFITAVGANVDVRGSMCPVPLTVYYPYAVINVVNKHTVISGIPVAFIEKSRCRCSQLYFFHFSSLSPFCTFRERIFLHIFYRLFDTFDDILAFLYVEQSLIVGYFYGSVLIKGEPSCCITAQSGKNSKRFGCVYKRFGDLSGIVKSCDFYTVSQFVVFIVLRNDFVSFKRNRHITITRTFYYVKIHIPRPFLQSKTLNTVIRE